MFIKTTDTTQILILGAGFGGLYTADHLERYFRNDLSVRITIVDQHN